MRLKVEGYNRLIAADRIGLGIQLAHCLQTSDRSFRHCPKIGEYV